MGQFADTASAMGIQAVQGYHAGAIRELLIQEAYSKVVFSQILVKDLTGVQSLASRPCSSAILSKLRLQLASKFGLISDAPEHKV